MRLTRFSLDNPIAVTLFYVLVALAGLAGIAIMFNPFAFDWSNRDALIGNGLLLLAAVLCV